MTPTKEDLRRDNEEIAEKWPRTVYILRCGYCVECVNRGETFGCKLGLLPITKERKSCRRFKLWAPGNEEDYIRLGRAMLRRDVEFQRSLSQFKQ